MPDVLKTMDAHEAGEILGKYLEQRSMTQRQLADATSIDPTYISNFVNGRVNLARSEHLGQIARVLRISREDLVRMNPLLDLTIHQHPSPRQASATELEDQNLSPVYAIADAHRPESFQTKPIRDLQIWIAPDNRRAGLRLYAASGRSMDNGAQNAIKDGHVLFVDTHSREPRDNAIYVIHVHGDGNCVKRARVLGGQFWLFSDNSDQGKYPPFQPDEADIIGEVYLFQSPPAKP